MVRKAVTTLVVAGSVVLGVAGTANAQPGGRCSDAANRIAGLQGQETRLANEVASLEARMGQHHRDAWYLRREVSALTRQEAGLAAQVQHLQAVCSGTGTAGTTSSTSTTSTTVVSGGGTTTVGSTFAD